MLTIHVGGIGKHVGNAAGETYLGRKLEQRIIQIEAEANVEIGAEAFYLHGSQGVIDILFAGCLKTGFDAADHIHAHIATALRFVLEQQGKLDKGSLHNLLIRADLRLHPIHIVELVLIKGDLGRESQIEEVAKTVIHDKAEHKTGAPLRLDGEHSIIGRKDKLIRILELVGCIVQTDEKAIRELAVVVVRVVSFHPICGGLAAVGCALAKHGGVPREQGQDEEKNYFRPVYIELMPNVSGLHVVFLNPTRVRISSNFLPSGKAATDSGRYVYADRSFEIILPILGKMALK